MRTILPLPHFPTGTRCRNHATRPRSWASTTARLLPALFASWVVCACGTSSGEEALASAPSAVTPAQRGSLIENPPVLLASFTGADLEDRLAATEFGEAALTLITDTPVCAVDMYQIRYETVGGRDEPTTASGALMIPIGADPACQGGRPIVLYAHGTAAERNYNIANLDDPENFEGLLTAIMFAGQGYIVVAPNYAGYDSSTLTYHPYLVADQQSKDTTDALTAARSALPVSTAPGVTDGGKLFVSGYSQGGYVAMATHRALEASGTAVTAAAPMSGPYALAAMGDAVFLGNVGTSGPLNMALLTTVYQRVYGNIYAAPTDVFEARYASGIESLLPTTLSRSELYAQGLLPRDALFSETPPDPAFAPITPPTEPEALAPVFARGFGPEHLITNGYRLAYLLDVQANPDGGFPTTTTGLPPANPGNTFRQALARNDLRNWSPVAPVLLCAGNEDPTVFFFNTQLMQGYWAANSPDAAVTVLDVDSPVADNDPYAEIKDDFALAKDLVAAIAVAEGASDGGRLAVLDAYHGGLVGPFCLKAAKTFFDGF